MGAYLGHYGIYNVHVCMHVHCIYRSVYNVHVCMHVLPLLNFITMVGQYLPIIVAANSNGYDGATFSRASFAYN